MWTWGVCKSKKRKLLILFGFRIFVFWLPWYGGRKHDVIVSKKLWNRLTNVKHTHKRIGYDLNVMRQSACLVINPIAVDNFAALFNRTPVDRASDSKAIHINWLGPEIFRLLLGPPGLN